MSIIRIIRITSHEILFRFIRIHILSLFSIPQTYYERAKICITPTKKGKQDIDEAHPCFTVKYLKNKPVRELKNDDFLKMVQAEQEG